MTRTYGPYLEMARIQSEINRLFEHLGQLRGGAESDKGFVPTADVLDRGDHLEVELEVPGIAAEDISLAVNGPEVIVRGEKAAGQVPGEEAVRHASERSFGVFERVITLGAPVNTHKAEATLRQGLLRIVFPKVNNKRGEPVTIAIREE